jgi:hypothetical protein
MEEEISLVLDNEIIGYKLSLIIWGQNKIFAMIRNPLINQASIRAKWNSKKKIIEDKIIKRSSINFSSNEFLILRYLDKKIHKISCKMCDIPTSRL